MNFIDSTHEARIYTYITTYPMNKKNKKIQKSSLGRIVYTKSNDK